MLRSWCHRFSVALAWHWMIESLTAVFRDQREAWEWEQWDSDKVLVGHWWCWLILACFVNMFGNTQAILHFIYQWLLVNEFITTHFFYLFQINPCFLLETTHRRNFHEAAMGWVCMAGSVRSPEQSMLWSEHFTYMWLWCNWLYYAVIAVTTLLNKLLTRCWSLAAGICSHSATRALLLSATIHPHQTGQTISLWSWLCAWGPCHVETGKGFP